MTLERRLNITEEPRKVKEEKQSIPEEPEVPIPFPELVRVPIFGEDNVNTF